MPPQLLVAEGLGQVTTLVGQPLEIPCQASGSPVPTIQCVCGGREGEGQGCGWGVGRERMLWWWVGSRGTPFPEARKRPETCEQAAMLPASCVSCWPCLPWPQADRPPSHPP